MECYDPQNPPAPKKNSWLKASSGQVSAAIDNGNNHSDLIRLDVDTNAKTETPVSGQAAASDNNILDARQAHLPLVPSGDFRAEFLGASNPPLPTARFDNLFAGTTTPTLAFIDREANGNVPAASQIHPYPNSFANSTPNIDLGALNPGLPTRGLNHHNAETSIPSPTAIDVDASTNVLATGQILLHPSPFTNFRPNTDFSALKSSLPAIELESPNAEKVSRGTKQYREFSANMSRLSSLSSLPDIDMSVSGPYVHNKYKIKNVHNFICDTCHEKNKSAALFQCTACVQKICTECIEEKCKDLSRPFDWNSDRHEILRPAYLDRKAKGIKGDYEGLGVKILVQESSTKKGTTKPIDVLLDADETKDNLVDSQYLVSSSSKQQRSVKPANRGTRLTPINLDDEPILPATTRVHSSPVKNHPRYTSIDSRRLNDFGYVTSLIAPGHLTPSRSIHEPGLLRSDLSNVLIPPYAASSSTGSVLDPFGHHLNLSRPLKTIPASARAHASLFLRSSPARLRRNSQARRVQASYSTTRPTIFQQQDADNSISSTPASGKNTWNALLQVANAALYELNAVEEFRNRTSNTVASTIPEQRAIFPIDDDNLDVPPLTQSEIAALRSGSTLDLSNRDLVEDDIMADGEPWLPPVEEEKRDDQDTELEDDDSDEDSEDGAESGHERPTGRRSREWKRSR